MTWDTAGYDETELSNYTGNSMLLHVHVYNSRSKTAYFGG
jgi:hypothetical protein